ncbi:uracil-xanthine permease family protein [Litoribrevibacter albus]|uniref:Uracil permease n=1 Tax=Litoribrevibacter albus TaxID=1473156 RepID=A0AA37W7G1_9GAMM|nr:uracil-xanthine permease family protein [Litoribrevibacter albus]GLQ32547.1 uracil permease [Litoribrevibacter albus]
MNNMKTWQTALLGGQMLFVAFGALVLVPILTGLDPAVALFTAGIGTLIFQLVTKREVPVFLASSFAFIAPIIYGTQTWGIAATMSGLAAAGVLYMVLSALIAWRGQGFIHRLLPPVVVGPVIMVIGLGLAPVAVHMAMGQAGDGSAQLVDQTDALVVAAISLFVTIGVSVFAKGLFRLLPILSGIIAGYAAAIAYGMVDFKAVNEAAWFVIPNFTLPEWNWQAVLYILPIAIAPAVEHIGDVTAISAVANKDFLKKPGLHRTMLGDGLATSAAALVGGPPNTTYSEVSGAVALTKAFNPVIMTWAAVFAIVLSFCGKLGAMLSTIPVPVMGGILILLFGTIAAIGMNTLVKAQADLTAPRNLVIVAVTLVFGIGGMALQVGDLMLKGIGLAAIAAIVLNLVLPKHLGE